MDLYLESQISPSAVYHAIDESVQDDRQNNIGCSVSIDDHLLELPLLRKQKTKIAWSDIVYIESLFTMSTMYYLENQKVRSTSLDTNSKNLFEILPKQIFFRVHRSIFVNMQHIDSYGQYPKMTIELMQGNLSLPLAKRRKQDFHNCYLEYAREQKVT